MARSNARRRGGLTLAGVSFALVFWAAPGALLAWDEATYRAVAEDSLRLLPPSLQEVVEPHKDAIIEGAAEPLSLHKKGKCHTYDPTTGKGDLIKESLEAIKEGVKLVEQQKPFKEVARQLGIMCHLAVDLADPLRTSDEDPREADIAEDFAAFAVRQKEKFRPFFHGYPPGFLSKGLEPVLQRYSSHSSTFYPILLRAYHPGGERVSSEAFDERSTAFGVASVCFSQALLTTGAMWVYFWHHSHGDMEGTLFLNKEHY
jgi:hypothetical protein